MNKILVITLISLIIFNSFGFCLENQVNVERVQTSISENETPIVINPSLPSKMITCALNSEVVSPMTDGDFQLLIDAEVIYCRDSHFEDGKLVFKYDNEMNGYTEEVMKIAKVLAVHAKKNGHTIAIGPDDLDMGIFVWYGESLESLKTRRFMFRFGFRRPKGVYGDEKIDGKTYPIDKEIELLVFTAPVDLYDEIPYTSERINYMVENEYTDVNAFYAFYDGLRLLDSSVSQDLFMKIIDDYCYALTNVYGETGGRISTFATEYHEWFEFENEKICKVEWRNSHGKYVSIDYLFLKQFNKEN